MNTIEITKCDGYLVASTLVQHPRAGWITAERCLDLSPEQMALAVDGDLYDSHPSIVILVTEAFAS